MSNRPLAFTSSLRIVDNVPFTITWLLIFDSLHFIFARLLLPYLSPVTSGMYVMGIATVEVAIFMAIWGQIRLDVFRRHIRFFLSIGFLVAISAFLSYAAVAFIDPGTASLLAKSSLLFGVGFGLIWLRERLTVFEAFGSFIAVIGLFIIDFQINILNP